MIKIELNNIGKIKDDYFLGVEKMIMPRAKLFLLAFQVMDGQAAVGDLESFTDLKARTTTSLLKLLVNNKATFRSKSDYHNITLAPQVKTDYFANRVSYINLFNDLSNKIKLRELVLADIDQLQAQSSLWTKAFFNDLTTDLIINTIDYGKFSKKDTDSYNAYSLADTLQVNVCPYCNRTYTTTIITKKNEEIVRPTFDHFYNQAVYPLLGLSFYNLIPACNNCNSSLKGQKPFNLSTHAHPYKEGFDNDAVFDFTFKAFKAEKSHPENYQVLLNVNTSSLKQARISNNIKDFKLKEIYQTHADIVGEIAVKIDKASPYYAMSLFESLPSLKAFSKREFYRYYFGNYFDANDFNKRPLAKLTKDIVGKYLPELTLEIR